MEAKIKMTNAAVQEMQLQFKENRRGQICAVIVALAFLGAGVYLVNSGHPWPGALLGGLGGGGVGLQTIISAFLRRRGETDETEPKTPVPAKKKGKGKG